jgi:hypothetical protein
MLARCATTNRATGRTGISLCDQTKDGLQLSEKKVKARMREVIRTVIAERTLQQYLECRKRITRYVRDNGIRGDHLISGKNYIFPLFISRMANVVSHRGNADQLKVRLARNYNPQVDPWLARRVRTLSGSVNDDARIYAGL